MLFATFRLGVILFFRSIGNLVFYRSKKRKPIALNNINLCFPVKNKKDKKRNIKYLKGSFISLGHTFADFLLLRFYNKKNIDKFVRIKNLHYFDEALSLKKGVIISTAHFGSWELAAHLFALKGFKSLILYNPIKSPQWLEAFIKNNREVSGNVLISKKNSLLNVYKKIMRGGIVTIISDQNCTPGDGLRAPLFGHDVWTHSAFIKLSLKTGAPIVPGFIFTKGLQGYEIEAFKPLYPQDFVNLKDPEFQMACASNKILEKVICKAPEQWMWQHRRFKDL